MKKIILPILFLCVLNLVASKKELDKRDRLFLDFAWQENYYQTGYRHQQLQLNDIEVDSRDFLEDDKSAANYAKKIKDKINLQRYGYDGRVYPYYEGKEIPYPHELITTEVNDTTYNVVLKIFIPDAVESATFLKEDVGVERTIGLAKVKLLEMQDDCSIFLVENLEKTNNYSYIYGYRTDDKERSTPQPQNDLKYAYDRFLQESQTENSSQQLTFNIEGTSGRSFTFKGSSTDFRHYLWYRNNDMPYPSMLDEYSRIQKKYQELDQNPDKKFHPIYTVFIRSAGEAAKAEISWKSKSGNVSEIYLGQYPLSAKQRPKDDDEVNVFGLSAEDDLTNSIKIRLNEAFVYNESPPTIKLYASLPAKYETKKYDYSLKMRFMDVYAFDASGDSTKIEHKEMDTDVFKAGFMYYDRLSNVCTATFPDNGFTKIKGAVSISYPDCTDSVFIVPQMPSGFMLESPNKLNFNTYETRFAEMRVYDASKVLMHPNETGNESDDDAEIYPRAIHTLKIRYRSYNKQLEIPFVLEKKKDENSF